MALPNNRIVVTDLDFDEIKTNLKTYMQGQKQFSDYDFEGSGLSILLDVLAYNTHYNALYTNLAVNEAFIDSASKRSSVVSKAKELGYTPKSATCSTAVVNLTIEDPGTSPAPFYSIPRYAPFITNINNVTYTFVTVDSHIVPLNPATNSYTLSNVTIKQGTPVTNQFIVGEDPSFVIPNANIDTTTLIVQVQNNLQTSTIDTFVLAQTIVDVDGNSEVYFLTELDDNFYRIEFGNGIIGKQLGVGSVVTVTYLICDNDAPNGARSFSFSGAIPSSPGSASYVTIVTPAYGGSFPETVESIKWNAPRAFTSQNRCVTLEDYKTIISSRFSQIESISVWGGEDNVPPSYGDIFISIKPIGRSTLSDGDKTLILTDILRDRRVVTMHPKFVDPQYINVDLDVTFYYDSLRTPKSMTDIASLIQNTIIQYNSRFLNKFDGMIRFSQLQRFIDDSEQSITHSIITLKLRRPFVPVYNRSVDYIIDLGNPIYNSGVPEQSILTTGFNVLNTVEQCYIEDSPTPGTEIGTLKMFYYTGNVKVYVRDVGSVDYSTGYIKIQNIIITSSEDNVIDLIIKPQSNDVVSVRNQIVNISAPSLKIAGVSNTINSRYTFTSSRN